MKSQLMLDSFRDQLMALEHTTGFAAKPKIISAPLLGALKSAGTSHVYADTADSEELRKIIEIEQDTIIEEIDGNTVNQPLAAKVIHRYLEQDDLIEWVREFRGQNPAKTNHEMVEWLYAVVCGRIGNDMIRAFASSRSWEVSLQLHMGLMASPDRAHYIGRILRTVVPSALVKVPFTPHAPVCFLVARDLEQKGVPVNFTSTFSARQVVAAALLSNATRTNVFMGRLDQGLHAKLLGAHVTLEAQRQLIRLRSKHQTHTQLIVASLRDWHSVVQTAGCDVYTIPCQVIRDFLQQQEVSPADIKSQLDTSYEDRLKIPETIVSKLGADYIARLYTIEPEFVEFLLEYRKTTEYQNLEDGDQLVRRFEAAGFKDVFYAPTESEWSEMRRGKIPDLDAPLTQKLALDTLYSLLADADFEKCQEGMDREMEQYLNRED